MCGPRKAKTPLNSRRRCLNHKLCKAGSSNFRSSSMDYGIAELFWYAFYRSYCAVSGLERFHNS